MSRLFNSYSDVESIPHAEVANVRINFYASMHAFFEVLEMAGAQELLLRLDFNGFFSNPRTFDWQLER
jgi:hypothetical protein